MNHPNSHPFRQGQTWARGAVLRAALLALAGLIVVAWLIAADVAPYGTGEAASPPPAPRAAPPPNATAPSTPALIAAAAEMAVRPPPGTQPAVARAAARLTLIREQINAGQEGGSMLFATPTPTTRSATTQLAEEKRFMRGLSLPQSEQAMAMFVDKCSACHGVSGYGDGPWSTELSPQPANLSLVNDSPDMVRSIILNGIPGTMMPAFPQTGNRTIEDILLYVALQPRDLTNQWSYPWPLHTKLGEEVKNPNLAAGKQHFLSFCSGCHGSGGEGDGMMAQVPTIWPRPANLVARDSDVGRLYEIISEGRPGTFGPLSSELLDREIGDWNRFANRRQVASYTGLCPGEDTSGDSRMSLSIDKHGNPRVRAVLVELAWLLPRYQPDYKPLQRWKWVFEPGGKAGAAQRKKAVVALGRRLAVDFWRIRTGRARPKDLGLKLA